MPWTQWRARFEARRHRERPAIGDIGEIPPSLRPALATSLARFQLGETGEGRIVADLRRKATAWNLSPDYLEALRLFIAEEGRHASILGEAVRALGGRTQTRTWSADGFARVRRLGGPGFELLVLLAAEVAALSFYGLLAERLPAGPLREAIREIAADEVIHLRFHVEFLRTHLPARTTRRAVTAAWSPLGMSAGAVIAADHGATLGALGSSRREVLARAHELVGDTMQAIFDAPMSTGRTRIAFTSFCGPMPACGEGPRASASASG
ncbi:ferritin-like domain-containing protein [Paraliomyxa miuraensis]|uniref:ferritin-like domain-containing protein n=1 Tax=Paraliomyxa miuraensis TaxID=376150 RepID=UPI0022512024|nr:ferritin-like domain-containing protein [Paraliomyxa miuraensis]MCX4240986.1 ferritin-like domain-containing protein [Paraliomyxa miuraensis]